jgi:hypothetical protein
MNTSRIGIQSVPSIQNPFELTEAYLQNTSYSQGIIGQGNIGHPMHQGIDIGDQGLYGMVYLSLSCLQDINKRFREQEIREQQYASVQITSESSLQTVQRKVDSPNYQLALKMKACKNKLFKEVIEITHEVGLRDGSIQLTDEKREIIESFVHKINLKGRKLAKGEKLTADEVKQLADKNFYFTFLRNAWQEAIGPIDVFADNINERSNKVRLLSICISSVLFDSQRIFAGQVFPSPTGTKF